MVDIALHQKQGSYLWLGLGCLGVVALGLIFRDGVSYMVHQWGGEEYSYAYLIPPLTAWLIWQQRAELAAAKPSPSWWGVAVVTMGVIIAIFGELSTIYTVIQYAFILTIFGLALTLVGWRGLRVIGPALFYLVFVVPLPNFLFQSLSAELQLISSTLGVALIRAFDISVFLEGNVIDLGIYQLQVVEACSGLRYLFPLLSFGYLCALLYKGPLWHKLILIASTLPITVVVNSVRIGIIGVLVAHAGTEMAEGFLHFFEGWIIFLVAVIMLLGEMWLLARISGRRGRLGDLLQIEKLWPQKTEHSGAAWRLGAPTLVATCLLVVGAAGMMALPARSEIVPQHTSYELFPLQVGEWRGAPLALEQKYIDVLQFTDYVLANYARDSDRTPVNFYVAYYGSQRKGASIHSPASCIPGGGWEITDLRTISFDQIYTRDEPLSVNRAVIGKGRAKQLVYYWFDQRGRVMTNEYHVKIMLFWDALTRQRTDGALVRLVTSVGPGEDLAAADRRLQVFLKAIYPQVTKFVPA